MFAMLMRLAPAGVLLPLPFVVAVVDVVDCC